MSTCDSEAAKKLFFVTQHFHLLYKEDSQLVSPFQFIFNISHAYSTDAASYTLVVCAVFL